MNHHMLLPLFDDTGLPLKHVLLKCYAEGSIFGV